MSEYLDNPPDDDQRITELWAWIATHANGAEGIMSADVQMPGMGTRHVPLIASKRATADHLGPLARKIQRAAMHQANRLTNIRLVRFVASE
jgi:hypothetical protein